MVDATLLKNARNIGEAEANERHLIRGETVSWCDQGFAWAEQDVVSWFYVAALLFVVLPDLQIQGPAKQTLDAPTSTIEGWQRPTD
jgi:hypothetical protein